MDLLTCLQTSPYRHLTAISRSLGLSCNTRTPKADLVHQLRDHLANLTLQWTHEDLSAKEQDALHSLATHNGRLPLHNFTHAFGPIRPYRPWRRDGPTHPWRHPISTTEKLLYQGLIYLTPSDPQRRQPRHIILPTEVLEHLTPSNPPTDAQPAPLLPSFDPLLDLALFLTYLQRTHVRPLHGRWLSPRHLRALGPCLSPPEPCQSIRSELQASRIPFIHYLAESLGLIIPVSDHLKPSPSALAWLNQPRPAQLQALWKTWLSPTDDNRVLWNRYRLPGHTLRNPLGFAQRLARLLAALPANTWLTLLELRQSPHLALYQLIPWWEQKQDNPAQHLLQQTLEGPLSWLGLTRYRPGDLPDTQWRLTSLGAWLLGRPEASPPQDDTQPLTLDEHLVLALPSQPQLDGLLALAEWIEIGPGPQLRLTPSSVAHALERGGDLQDLFATLARYATPCLTPAQRATLQSWGQDAIPLTLRPCILLEAVDPDQMIELWGERTIRPHLGRQFTTKLATVHTPDPDRFIQALRRRGLPVRSLLANHTESISTLPASANPQSSGAVSPGNSSGPSRDHQNGNTPAKPLPPGDAFWLTVAFLVHTHLARRLSLTPIPPAAALHRLIPSLGAARLAAAEATATEAIARLNEALDGPAPLTPTITQDALLKHLEAAIQGDEPLHIRYWSAWRGEITERCVQPQRLEWRGDRIYLMAHCHLRSAQRTFRLDRILNITQCEKVPDSSPSPGPSP